jgi:amino acid adenylation domain-containing protein
MKHKEASLIKVPPEQEAIRAKCFHPTGTFEEFRGEEIEQSIPERFEKIARRYPNRLAVKTKNKSLTYEALNQAANCIGNAILSRCGEEEQPVAVLLEHGADAIAAILAVSKSAKAYVPLDSRLLQERAKYILEDTQARLILTDTRNLSYAAQLHNGRYLVNIDDLDLGSFTENLGLSVSPDTLAYVLYTSGSAGQPKGVVQTHRNVLSQIKRETNSLHFCAEDRLTLIRSFSAIGGVRVIFSALLNGAAAYPLNIAGEGYDSLADSLFQEEITIYDSAATPFRRFVANLTGEERFPKLRVIRLSSEPIYQRDIDLYKKHFSSGCVLVNSLGLTETGGSIRSYFIDHETEVADTVVPVGYGVEDVEVFLLDDHGHEVGSEGSGEIAARSRYLSPGYWRKPDLTQAKFLADPRGGDQRVYLTGDLGRMLPDGCLVPLGRRDDQVKIRAYRIDIGEIERALRAIDIIEEAAVIKREDRLDEQYLAAYVVTTKKPFPTVSGLRRALSKTLPEYMIPSAFIMLGAMPLTPTGKVDRRALPAPGTERPDLDTPFVGPKTHVENELIQIWTEILPLDQIGIHDNFFDLGGHSLAAMRVVSRVSKKFQLEVPLQSLFQSPTVAQMAAVIMQNQLKKLGDEDLANILVDLESLSDEQATQSLIAKRSRKDEIR